MLGGFSAILLATRRKRKLPPLGQNQVWRKPGIVFLIGEHEPRFGKNVFEGAQLLSLINEDVNRLKQVTAGLIHHMPATRNVKLGTMRDIQIPLLKDEGSKLYFHDKIMGKKGYKYKDKNLAGIIERMLKQATGKNGRSTKPNV